MTGQSRSRRSWAGAFLFSAAVLTLLIALGLWQLRRLEWKEGLIAAAETRLSEAPVALPAAPTPAQDEFRAVRVEGAYAPGEEAYVAANRAPDGPGFRILAAFLVDEGEGAPARRILVDRGYVPAAKREPATRPESLRPEGPLNLTGILRWPDESSAFLPAPDLARKIWFERDVAALSAALGTEPVLLLAADEDPQALPIADPPDVRYSNKHLEYAGTWLSLAAAWALMSFFWLRRLARRPELDSQGGGGV